MPLNPVLPPPRRKPQTQTQPQTPRDLVGVILNARDADELRGDLLHYEWVQDNNYKGSKGGKWVDTDTKKVRYQPNKPGTGRGGKKAASEAEKPAKDPAAGKKPSAGKKTAKKPAAQKPAPKVSRNLAAIKDKAPAKKPQKLSLDTVAGELDYMLKYPSAIHDESLERVRSMLNDLSAKDLGELRKRFGIRGGGRRKADLADSVHAHTASKRSTPVQEPTVVDEVDEAPEPAATRPADVKTRAFELADADTLDRFGENTSRQAMEFYRERYLQHKNILETGVPFGLDGAGGLDRQPADASLDPGREERIRRMTERASQGRPLFEGDATPQPMKKARQPRRKPAPAPVPEPQPEQVTTESQPEPVEMKPETLSPTPTPTPGSPVHEPPTLPAAPEPTKAEVARASGLLFQTMRGGRPMTLDQARKLMPPELQGGAFERALEQMKGSKEVLHRGDTIHPNLTHKLMRDRAKPKPQAQQPTVSEQIGAEVGRRQAQQQPAAAPVTPGRQDLGTGEVSGRRRDQPQRRQAAPQPTPAPAPAPRKPAPQAARRAGKTLTGNLVAPGAANRQARRGGRRLQVQNARSAVDIVLHARSRAEARVLLYAWTRRTTRTGKPVWVNEEGDRRYQESRPGSGRPNRHRGVDGVPPEEHMRRILEAPYKVADEALSSLQNRLKAMKPAALAAMRLQFNAED